MHPAIEKFCENLKTEILDHAADRLNTPAAEIPIIQGNIEKNKLAIEECRKHIKELEAKGKALKTERANVLTAGKSPLEISKEIRETKVAVDD